VTTEEIKKALEIRGLDWASAAAAIGKSRSMVYSVAARTNTSRPVALALCALIESTPDKAFPDVVAYHVDPEEDRAEAIEAGRERIRAAGLVA